MQFEILKSIVENEIEKFLLDYRHSMKLFSDNKKNGLHHPGEYGAYKENLCKELFEFALPGKYQVGSGFVYNQYKEITTQCDVIVYDFNNTPLMRLDNKQRFYPNETVLAIGEIKSVLTKKELVDTLIKLAKNKEIRKTTALATDDKVELRYNNETGISDGYNLHRVSLKCTPEDNPLDGIFTFLICDKIKGFNSGIGLIEYINDKYKEAEIKQYNRHNIIVSIKDGLILYEMNGKPAQYPCHNEKECFTDIIRIGSEIDHIKMFLTYLNTHIKIAHHFYPEPLYYI